MAPMGKADLHIHTNHGDGLDSVEAILDYVESATDLDVIAVTEHDNLAAAHAAREHWARGRYRFDLIAGVEVTTLQGHLIALYLEEPVESLRPIEETIDAIHRRGGVSFVPHPFSWLTRSVGAASFDRVAAQKERGTWFDAIELANESPAARRFQERARALNAARYRLPAVGASDAHFVQAIGSARTLFPGAGAADLRAAIASGATRAASTRYPALSDVGLLRTLSLPVAGLRATPKALGWRRTAWSFVSRYFS
jgi:predicted metal-dependent phosphoesterase TrpH